MKKRGKIILAAVLIIIGVLSYSWFYVRGEEIKGVSEITSDCTVTIKVGDEGEKSIYSPVLRLKCSGHLSWNQLLRELFHIL